MTTSYVVGIWLTKLENQKALTDFLDQKPDENGNAESLFGKATNIKTIDTRFLKGIFFVPPLPIFDILDQLPLGQNFKGDFLRATYPVQFGDHNSIICLYAKKNKEGAVNKEMFNYEEGADRSITFLGKFEFRVEE